jgi:hypothetical protein
MTQAVTSGQTPLLWVANLLILTVMLIKQFWTIMSIHISNTIRNRSALILGAVLMPSLVLAGESTAFDLIKEGNRYIGEQAKDKVVQIRSEKSIGSMEPVIWYVVYYDPTASLKAVEVKFGAGKMIDVKRPMRLLEPVSGGDTPIDREKLKVDSDEAIKTASKEPLLGHVKLTAVALKVEKSREGGPVWKVKFWAQKLRKPAEDVNIGEVHLSAVDGKVIKTDLHINRVD